FFSSRRRHTRFKCDWSSDVCSSDLGIVGELQRDLLGGEERAVLLDQIGAGFAEDADEVLLAERLELDTDREAALELGQHVARLRSEERRVGKGGRGETRRSEGKKKG